MCAPKRMRRFGFASLMVVLGAASAQASELFADPFKGQATERHAVDERECTEWAARRTGFGPDSPAPVYLPPAQRRGGTARSTCTAD